jgi:hypothetical protein
MTSVLSVNNANESLDQVINHAKEKGTAKFFRFQEFVCFNESCRDRQGNMYFVVGVKNLGSDSIKNYHVRMIDTLGSIRQIGISNHKSYIEAKKEMITLSFR